MKGKHLLQQKFINAQDKTSVIYPFIIHSNSLVVKALDSQFRGPLFKAKVDSAFHLSEVDKMSTRNFWELSGKKYTASSKRL